MSETSPEPINLTGIDSLQEALSLLRIRPVIFHRFSSLGKYTPRKTEWLSGYVRSIGHGIAYLYDESSDGLILKSSKEPAIPSRQETLSRVMGFSVIRDTGRPPLTEASVEGVNWIDTGKKDEFGKRMEIPVLRLLDIERPADDPYSLTLSDLAHLVRTGSVELASGQLH